MKSAYLPNCFDKPLGFAGFIEDKLTTGNAAIHVICRFGNKEAGFSRNGTPPMRGRDLFILTVLPLESTMR